MVTRIRRNWSTTDADLQQVDILMKSISDSQDVMALESKAIADRTATLYALMKKLSLGVHQNGDIKALCYRPAGRSSTTIDPMGYRKAVKDDKEFYGSIKVSVTEAKKVLPAKVLATISSVVAAVAGEETVKVSRG